MSSQSLAVKLCFFISLCVSVTWYNNVAHSCVPAAAGDREVDDSHYPQHDEAEQINHCAQIQSPEATDLYLSSSFHNTLCDDVLSTKIID